MPARHMPNASGQKRFFTCSWRVDDVLHCESPLRRARTNDQFTNVTHKPSNILLAEIESKVLREADFDGPSTRSTKTVFFKRKTTCFQGGKCDLKTTKMLAARLDIVSTYCQIRENDNEP
jgi:hypothetical protein